MRARIPLFGFIYLCVFFFSETLLLSDRRDRRRRRGCRVRYRFSFCRFRRNARERLAAHGVADDKERGDKVLFGRRGKSNFLSRVYEIQ